MAKRQKKNQGGVTRNSTLDRALSDQSTYFALLPEDFSNYSPVVLKILADFKHLLEMPAQNFWATINYNYTLQDSLDLFLRYAPRKHFSNPMLQDYSGKMISHIYRCIMATYLRMTDLAAEDAVLAEQIGVYEILYQNWIIDVMKLTDICQVFGDENPKACKHLSNFVFQYQAYREDFVSTITLFEQKVLAKIYTDLLEINNKSYQDQQIYVDDCTLKMELLVLALDSVETLITWAKFFPNPEFYFHPVRMALLEQIFFEFSLARGYQRGTEIVKSLWKINQLPININVHLEQLLARIINYFVLYLNYLQELITTNQMKQIVEHMVYIVKNFGFPRRKTLSKKQNVNDVKIWILLEGIQEAGFNMVDMLQSLVPWNQIAQLNLEEVQDVLDRMQLSVAERCSLKENKKPIEDDEEFELYDPGTSKLKDLQIVDEQVEENEAPEKANQNIDGIPPEETLTVLISKKKQKVILDQPIAERTKLAELTLKIYNDEPDDAFEPYEQNEGVLQSENIYSDDEQVEPENDLVPWNDTKIQFNKKQKPYTSNNLDKDHRVYSNKADHSDDETKTYGNRPKRQKFIDKDYQRDEDYSNQQTQQRPNLNVKILQKEKDTRNRDGAYVPTTNGTKPLQKNQQGADDDQRRNEKPGILKNDRTQEREKEIFSERKDDWDRREDKDQRHKNDRRDNRDQRDDRDRRGERDRRDDNGKRDYKDNRDYRDQRDNREYREKESYQQKQKDNYGQKQNQGQRGKAQQAQYKEKDYSDGDQDNYCEGDNNGRRGQKRTENRGPKHNNNSNNNNKKNLRKEAPQFEYVEKQS